MEATAIDRRQLLRTDLRDAIAAFAPHDGDFVAGDGIRLSRRSSPTTMNHGESSIAFCAIGQGAKHVEIGDCEATYGPEQFLITSCALPMVSHVVEASESEPYLSMSFDLSASQVKSVLMETEPHSSVFEMHPGALCTYEMSTGLLDAVVRLMKAQGDPLERSYLTPMIQREIIFRLHSTKHAGRLYEIAGMSPVSNQIKTALDHIRDQFVEPLRVADIASHAGMSVSTFHEHFKRVTGLTPLQYQKQLRLREARHLLLVEDLDAAEAGFTVGYSDASHFNRDYKRMFGLPPIRDIEQMRESEDMQKTG